MFERADVLDVQGGEWGIFLMGLAILAAVTRAFPYPGSRGGIDSLNHIFIFRDRCCIETF